MDKVLGLEIADLNQRRQYLNDNCDRIENTGYMKKFNPEELLEMKERLALVSIEINDIQEEKKSTNDVFKERLKPIAEERLELVSNIKHGSEFVSEPCYLLIDTEAKEVGIYNEEGFLVSQRPATAQELQTTIFQVVRTGTHD